jgi:integrase
MAIVKAPRKADPHGKCSRWRVVIYNRYAHKHEWHTVAGTKADAEALERKLQTKLGARTYIPKVERMTLEQVAAAFMKECRARNRRTSTILNYKSILDRHVLPAFGLREVGMLQKKDVRTWLADKLEAGASTELVNRVIRVLKAVLFYAMTDLEVLDRNVMLRFRPFQGINPKQVSDRRARRGAYTESEVQALLAAARPQDRALIGTLCLTGMRPGEAYALRWSDLDLVSGSARIGRSWDHRSRTFVAPKTKAGNRAIPLSGWLVETLQAHQELTGRSDDDLVFAASAGRPMNPANVRRDIWAKLVQRAGVRKLDMYSLRHTFASLGRTAGEAAFNVAAVMGHSRSLLVDQVYAHSLQSGMASVAQRVTARALGEQPILRVVGGEKAPAVRQPLENSVDDQTVSAQGTDSMAPPAGVEPTTYRLGGGRSIH